MDSDPGLTGSEQGNSGKGQWIFHLCSNKRPTLRQESLTRADLVGALEAFAQSREGIGFDFENLAEAG